jgi:outer membrane receptor protein involved in Fe transport
LGTASANAAPAGRQQVDISGGRLSAALTEFARETGTELLFDKGIVGSFAVAPVRGTFSRRDALLRLLSGTGLTFREVDGSFVLFRPPISVGPPVGTDLPVPEILVIGRRSQNTDIRRTRNDIQPYRVIPRSEIASAHRENLEELIRSREPINVQAVTPAQSTIGADTGSAFDFRGLGSLRSLILVDGRRLPSYPTQELDLRQPDVNGIPLGAVDRVETRTGTAGGIYGPGALGGVMNVVLRRDYNGAEVRVTSGITSRGDAPHLSVDFGLGFSPDEGRTQIMLAAGYRRSRPVLQGDRNYSVRQRQLQFTNSPKEYATLSPLSNAVLVFGSGGADLVFDEQYGGDSLGSPVTFLPVGFSGTPEEARELLRQNAGRTEFALAADTSASLQHLTASPTTTSVIANMRHQVSSAVEVYADALLLQNVGRQTSGGFGLRVTFPDAPTNPFNQFVRFVFPTALSPRLLKQESNVSRFSTGVVVRLPGGWSASGDYTRGEATASRNTQGFLGSNDLQSGLQLGTPRADGRVVDPLGSWEELMEALAAYTGSSSSTVRLKNRFEDATLRVGGPIVRLPGGPLTGTLLAERRREHLPDAAIVDRFSKPDRERITTLFERSQIVRSAYGEVRAPLTPEGGTLSNLQLQLALRYDHALSRIPNGVGSIALTPEERPTQSARQALTYTVGAQFSPLRALMLRASLATGEVPPSLAGLRATAIDLGSAAPSFGGVAIYPDPQRGGRPVGSERLIRVLFGGLENAPPERATTLTLGAVFNSRPERWPRLSIDYTRITLSRQPLINRFEFERPWGALPQLLATDSNRLLRAPLTDSDRALGYTGGIVTQADARGLLLGRSVVKALDVELDWALPAGAYGSFRFYGRGTWQPSLRRQIAQGEEWFDDSDDLDGPLTLRGHGGVEWTSDRTTIGANAQYFSSYRARFGEFTSDSETNANIRLLQGRTRISSQTYFDLSLRHRFSSSLELSSAVINIFDRSPPIVAARNNLFGYSSYGDARRRRFELAVSSKF